MQNQNHQRIQWIVLAVLILIGIASRFLIETPNFKPIAAFALFGGFYFRKPMFTVGALLVVMAVSDFQLGYYPWQLMLTVYLALAVSVLLGVHIRKRLGNGNASLGKSNLSFGHIAAFAGASIIMSTAFYVFTNGAVWAMGGWYPMTILGAIECYAMGLPFYRFTLMGDLLFTGATVGSYAAITMLAGNRSWSRKAQPLTVAPAG